MANIKSIVYQPLDQDYSDGRFDYFIRVPIEEINLIANYGIEDDAKAGHQPKRQLNFLTTEWLDERKAEGFQIGPGEFGEQIIIDGLTMAEIESGLQLQLGSQAIIEVTKPRTGCSRLEAAQGKIVPYEAKKAIGWLSTVIEGGIIKVGDEVKILELVK